MDENWAALCLAILKGYTVDDAIYYMETGKNKKQYPKNRKGAKQNEKAVC